MIALYALLLAVDQVSDAQAAEATRYQSDNAAVIASGKRPDVVFIGDSLTRYWHHFEPAFFRPEYVERGIGTQTSAQVLVRFQSDVISLHPKVVHILVGTNDVLGSRGEVAQAETLRNVDRMIALARENHIQAVLAGVLPMTWSSLRKTPLPASRVQSLNAGLKVMADRRKIRFVDYGPLISDGAGGQDHLMSQDGIHLSQQGFDRITPLAQRVLKAALAEAH